MAGDKAAGLEGEVGGAPQLQPEGGRVRAALGPRSASHVLTNHSVLHRSPNPPLCLYSAVFPVIFCFGNLLKALAETLGTQGGTSGLHSSLKWGQPQSAQGPGLSSGFGALQPADPGGPVSQPPHHITFAIYKSTDAADTASPLRCWPVHVPTYCSLSP